MVTQYLIVTYFSYFLIFSYFLLTLKFRFLYTQFCRDQNKTDMECYFKPFSRCTLQDALASYTWEETVIETRRNLSSLPTVNFNQALGMTFEEQIKKEIEGLPYVLFTSTYVKHCTILKFKWNLHDISMLQNCCETAAFLSFSPLFPIVSSQKHL